MSVSERARDNMHSVTGVWYVVYVVIAIGYGGGGCVDLLLFRFVSVSCI